MSTTTDQTLRVGRLLIPHAELTSVSSVSASGGSVSIQGRIASDLPEVNAAVRAALQGMIDDPDDPTIPIVFGADSSIDGFYTIKGGSTEAGAGAMNLGWWPFSLDLESGPNRGTWLWAAVVQGGLRANANGYTAGQCSPWYAVPAAAANFLWVDGNTDTTVPLDTGTGAVTKRRHGTTFDGYASWEMHPRNTYDGAALMEWRPIGAADWWPVVGRRTPPSMAAWRVGNGLVRVTYEGGPGLLFEVYRGSTYGWEGRTFQLNDGFAELSGVAVLRNDPSEVRIECSLLGTSVGSRWVTFVVRRGDTWLRGSGRATTLTGWSISQMSAGTWATSGLWAQSPPMTTGTLSRWAAMSTYPWSLHANGGITSTSPNLGSAWTFGISQTGIAVAGEFLTAQSDRVQATRR